MKKRMRMMMGNDFDNFYSSDESSSIDSQVESGPEKEIRYEKQIKKIIKNVKDVDTYDPKLSKELDNIHNFVQKDNMEKNRFFDRYGLKQIDTDHPEDIKIPENFEALEELEHKRQEQLDEKMLIYNKIKAVEETKDEEFVLTPFQKFKIYSKWIYEFLRLLIFLRKQKIMKIESKKMDFNDAIDLYMDIGNNWIINVWK